MPSFYQNSGEMKETFSTTSNIVIKLMDKYKSQSSIWSAQLETATARQHVVNIDDLTASIKEDLEMLLPLTRECHINRVPEKVRKFNEHYYTPKVVSIGPIHYRKEELRAMEEYKKRYLKDFLQLGQVSLKECLELVQKNETKLRNCYADTIELDSEDFVKMILLDAVFLLMIILYQTFPYKVDLPIGTKRIFEKPIKIQDIKYDLVLLENQLPFFIIEELYKLHKIHNRNSIVNLNDETAMIALAIEFLDRLSILDIPNRHPPTEVEHLLALFRSCLKPIDWNPKRKPLPFASIPMIPTIKELKQAGVKFKSRRKKNLFDIEFNNGVLEIPFVSVNSRTEVAFRNLAAFELCNDDLEFLCTDYFRMMQKLIPAPEDAEVLIRKKILDNTLPDAQAVTKLFHNLSSGFVYDIDNFGYSDVMTDLHAYCAVPWNRWKATWIQKYFTAPWAIFSVIGVVILLILTIIQTVCSILQVVKH